MPPDSDPEMQDDFTERYIRLGGTPTEDEFLNDYEQYRLLTELLIMVHSTTCTKPPAFRQVVIANVENFLADFSVLRIWLLIRNLKGAMRGHTEDEAEGLAAEDEVVDAYFHHQDSERANREMLRATRIMDRLAGFLGQNAG